MVSGALCSPIRIQWGAGSGKERVVRERGGDRARDKSYREGPRQGEGGGGLGAEGQRSRGGRGCRGREKMVEREINSLKSYKFFPNGLMWAMSVGCKTNTAHKAGTHSPNSHPGDLQ